MQPLIAAHAALPGAAAPRLPVFQQIERPDEVGIIPCVQYPQQSFPVEKPLCQQCFEQAPGPRFDIGIFRRRCYALFQSQSDQLLIHFIGNFEPLLERCELRIIPFQGCPVAVQVARINPGKIFFRSRAFR